MNQRADTGQIGEDIAAAHLESLGFEIVDRNWRCARGELDIVARRPGLTVAVEVKTRRTLRFGKPLEAITHEKLMRLRRLAVSWMRDHDQRGPLRLDGIGVELRADGVFTLEHVEAMS